MRRRGRFIGIIAGGSLVLAACGSPTGSPTPTPSSPSPTASPTPSPSPSPTAQPSAALIVTADGTVECQMYPHGCLASFIVEPGRWPAPGGWEPADDTPYFGAQPAPWELEGRSVIGAPETIAPGEYTFGIAVAELNDIVGDPDRFLWGSVLCTEAVFIPSGTDTVTVHANFDSDCSIDVTLEPPGPTPTPTSSGAAQCHHFGRTVDPPALTIEYVASVATGILAGDFAGYGISFWNTPDGAQPPGQPLAEGNAEIRTRFSVDDWQVLRGDPSVAERSVLSGFGTVGCSDWYTDQYPTFVVGQRYVFFLRPTSDSTGAVADDLVLEVAWPVVAGQMVETSRDGTITLDDLIELIQSQPGPTLTSTPSQ